VTIKVRYADFTTVTRSYTAAAPTRDGDEIVARALTLLARTEAGRRPIRLLGAGVHGLIVGDASIGVPGVLRFEG
jgi:DNA polymerase-4